MPDYQNAVIYKLWCVDNDLVYFGSTVNRLSKRLNEHKCRLECNSKLLFESSTDVRIELVEKFPCNDKNELNAREGYYIRNFNCVNKVVPDRTKEEMKERDKKYYREHKEERREQYRERKEEIKEYNKKYHQEHREERNKKAREKIKCVCGAEISRDSLARHHRTKKHLDLLN